MFSIQHATFFVPKETLKKKEITWSFIDRIGFRGDKRDPEEIVFKEGLLPKPRNKISKNTILIEKAFESAKKVVAITTRFRAAAMFPIDEKVKKTWVYIFKIDQAFDVHHHGYCAYAKTGLTKEVAHGLFVDELIVKKISPKDIILAARIIRYPYDGLIDKKPDYLTRALIDDANDFIDSGFYEACGKYFIEGYMLNKACTLPEDQKRMAIEFIENEIALNKKNIPSASQLPMPTTGFMHYPEKEKTLPDEPYSLRRHRS